MSRARGFRSVWSGFVSRVGASYKVNLIATFSLGQICPRKKLCNIALYFLVLCTHCEPKKLIIAFSNFSPAYVVLVTLAVFPLIASQINEHLPGIFQKSKRNSKKLFKWQMHWRATVNLLQNMTEASCLLGKEIGKYFVFDNVVKILLVGHNILILLKSNAPIN